MPGDFFPASRYPCSNLFVAASQLLVIVALMVPSTFPRRVAFSAVIVVVHVYLIAYTTMGSHLDDYGIGTVLGAQLMFAISKVLLVDAEKELRPLRQNVETNKLGLWERFKWAVTLYFNVRGIGWNFQIGGIQRPTKPSTRWRFVGARLLRVFWCYLLIDATYSAYRVLLPPFMEEEYRRQRQTIEGASLSYDYVQHQIKKHLFAMTWSIFPYAGLQMQQALGSIAAVGLGYSTPQDWPEAFGSFAQGYTVRRFWSRCWHQFHRCAFLSYANSIIRLFRLPPTSPILLPLNLVVAFTMSGLVHGSGDYMLQDTMKFTFTFFILQPVAIAVEEIIMWLGRVVGLSGMWRGLWKFLGFVWVVTWCSTTSIPVFYGMIKAGLTDREALPLSIVRGVLMGHWLVKT